MSRIVRSGLVKTRFDLDGGTATLDQIYDAQLKKVLGFVEEAGRQKVQILCFQELFNGPYFCAEQTTRWYDFTEPVPDGKTTRLFQDLAKKHGMAIVLPIYEFYGQSYFCDPRGKMLVTASRDKDELVVSDLDLDVIKEVRNTWQFFRDRRPETYGEMVEASA